MKHEVLDGQKVLKSE